MARYRGPRCRLCRREGMKLYLKGERCVGQKCPFEGGNRKRNYPPGEHGTRRRSKVSDYALHLREKQKVRRTYGVLERQFRRYFRLADRSKGVTGDVLLEILERRLDNVVHRASFANSREQARQLVRHNHVWVNGKRVNIPSYQVRAGDVVEIKPKSKPLVPVQEAVQRGEQRGIPAWLSVDPNQVKASVQELPRRADLAIPFEEQLIVEYYSK
ncbi:MAG: 30S ribosomal protein S4 [Nitrospinota bacterium]